MDVALITFDGVDMAAQAFADARDTGDASRGRWPDQIGLVEHHADGHLVLRGTFAGHYVDVDEAARTSEQGAAKGWGRGALAGLLLTPAGFAVGSVLGALIGSQEGEPGDTEREPSLVADKLRAAVPLSGSAIVLAAEPDVIDQMLGAFAAGHARVARRTLTAEESAELDMALGDAPRA